MADDIFIQRRFNSVLEEYIQFWWRVGLNCTNALLSCQIPNFSLYLLILWKLQTPIFPSMATWPPVPSCHFLLPTPLIGRGRANVGLLSVCLLSLQDFGHSNPVCPGCSLCHSIIGLNVLFILYEEGKICIQNAPSRIPLRSQWQRLLKRVNDKGNETIIHNLGQLGHMGEWTYEPN